MMKECTICNKRLEANSLNFFKNKDGYLGFSTWCKSCYKIHDSKHKIELAKEFKIEKKTQLVLLKPNALNNSIGREVFYFEQVGDDRIPRVGIVDELFLTKLKEKKIKYIYAKKLERLLLRKSIEKLKETDQVTFDNIYYFKIVRIIENLKNYKTTAKREFKVTKSNITNIKRVK